MISFKQFLTDSIEHQGGSETTQVATTTGTYRKTAERLKDLIPVGGRVLDYGAGLGEGTKAMQDVFGQQATVHSYEPSAGRSKNKPTFTNSDDIAHSYDAVVSHNVLNVLEPELRDKVTNHILSLVKPGGHAIIGTRKWSGDVNGAKNAEPGEEEKSLWISKKVKGGTTTKVYQKGFDGNELHDYVKDKSGDDFSIKKLSGIAANAVHLVKK